MNDPSNNQPFKFRHVNTLAGGFVLLCAFVLLAGIFIAGRAQGWFEARVRLIVEFTTQEGAYGLQEGAEIRIMDALAGRVTRIEPSEEGVLQAALEIREQFAGFVNRGSVALVRRKIVGLAGDAYIEIQPARPGFEPLVNGDRIEVQKDVEIVETVLKVLDDLETLLLPVLEETRGILENVNRTTAAIEEGRGTLGMLARDEQVADDLRQTIDAVRQSAAQLPLLVGQTEKNLEHFTGISSNVYGLTADLASEVEGVSGLIWETTDTVRELGVLTRGLQRHWLLRKHIEPSPTFPLPVPSDIGAAGREVLP